MIGFREFLVLEQDPMGGMGAPPPPGGDMGMGAPPPMGGGMGPQEEHQDQWAGHLQWADHLECREHLQVAKNLQI